jgi:hypothetical protein
MCFGHKFNYFFVESISLFLNTLIVVKKLRSDYNKPGTVIVSRLLQIIAQLFYY